MVHIATSLLSALRRLLCHRLVCFAIGGAVLFWLAPPASEAREVALDGARLDALVHKRARQEGAPLSRALRQEVLAEVIDDEILVREARRLGLDQDDAILRRRLVQKALFLAEDLAGASRPPTDQEVESFMATSAARYGDAPARAERLGVARLDLAIERRQAAVEAFLVAARRRYRVTIDGQAVVPPASTPRVAVRTAPSVED